MVPWKRKSCITIPVLHFWKGLHLHIKIVQLRDLRLDKLEMH